MLPAVVPTTRPSAHTVDEYIAAFPPPVQALLREVRRVVHAAAPDAEECLSYRIPAYKQAGVVVYFAAFKEHIGFGCRHQFAPASERNFC
jgi:uncharacterized protein YdhG (YjbR/CyaY superfamily)